MTFVKFVDTLYNTCSFGKNSIEEFVRCILMAMSGKKANGRLDDLSSSTLKNYYYKGLSKPIAKAIISDIDETEFRGMLSSVSVQTKENLAKAFCLDSPDSVSDSLTGMFSAIIQKVSGKELPVISIEKVSANAEKDIFDVYLKNSESDYNELKTLINPDNPQPFYKYYVCNRMRYRSYPNEGDEILFDATIDKLSEITHFAIISGTGGIGKSMMMRHLFLDAVKKYPESKRLPVFIPLRNFNTTTNTLLDFIYTCVAAYDDSICREAIIDKLLNGECILLLDGFDEIPVGKRDLFVESINNFIKQYKDNLYIVSSRPTNKYINLYRFSVFNILGMDKNQAVELVSKLDYHNKEAKEKFITDLKKTLYHSHTEFVSNPLLLTIMLMTYSYIGNIPQKRYRFYEEAFNTMARRHDATKGSFVRPMNTGLEPEDFNRYFSSFCALTYQKGKITFTESEFCKVMDFVIEKKNKSNNSLITSKNFLSDLINNLCLMYIDGNEIHFIHRSFQEYFCAVFFSEEITEKPKEITKFFNFKSSRNGDLAFDMLYEMVPDKIEKYIFLPYLDEKFGEMYKDGRDYEPDYDYLDFIDEIYGTIYSHNGNTDVDNLDNRPSENIYDFICKRLCCDVNDQLSSYYWIGFDEFKTEWVYMPEEPYNNDCEYGNWILVDAISDEFASYSSFRASRGFYDVIEIEGESWDIDIYELINNDDVSQLNELCSDAFPLKWQFNKVYEYWLKLKHQYRIDKDEEWLESLI